MKNDTKLTQISVMTAIVGSYPKPKYLFSGSGRKLLDNIGFPFYKLENKVGARKFKEYTKKAALMAIRDQDSAGIDFVTDGEEKRGHYVLHILRKLKGIDFRHVKQKTIRRGSYVRRVPVVVGKIGRTIPVLLDDYLYTAKHTKGIAKINIPGPTTVVDSVADEYYKGDKKRMAFDYALAIRHEVKNLIKAGCKVIQFDDPVLMRYPKRSWGIKALEKCFEGLNNRATFIVHVCRGYPDKKAERRGIRYKANQESYKYIIRKLRKSAIDIISIESAQDNLDLSVLKEMGNKRVMLGVVNVGSNRIESVASITKRGQEALQYISKKQLILAPDCGMLLLSRTAARGKLKNIAAAAAILK